MVKRISFYTVGLLIATLGVSLTVLSSVGAGPWDATFVGAMHKFGLTVGMWAAITQLVMILIAGYLKKKRPQFESAITVIIWGICIDFWLLFVFQNVAFDESSFLIQWGAFLIGAFLLGAGIGIYIVSKLPPAPMEGLMIAISERFKLSFMISRTILSLIGFLLAVLLQGPVGIGTLLLALLLGQFVQICHRHSQKIYDKL